MTNQQHFEMMVAMIYSSVESAALNTSDQNRIAAAIRLVLLIRASTTHYLATLERIDV
jgi:hypothetical protein